MSYAKSLRNTLKDKNETLFHRLKQVENAAKNVLAYTVSKFPYYTPHTFLHSQNVEEVLNWLVPDEIKPKMNEFEIFFLIVAAMLHDWGMVASKREDAEVVRNTHHIRTETNFENLHDKVHLFLTEARIVGRICRGHRRENLLGSEYDDSFFGSNILIRIRFLAALVRIADECDVTANRTPEAIYYSLKPEGASEEEYQAHLSITGIGKPAPYKLILNGVAKSPKGVEVIKKVESRIQNQLNSVKAILASQGIVLDLIKAHIDTRGFINKPIAFELDRKAIVDLLIGTALYSRKDVAIRELLQNSVDTCRLRRLLDNQYNPCIEIEFDKEHISFEDNGFGMNFEDALDYFSRKGSSFYVSESLKEALKGKKFDPISKFGVGVLSCFMLAHKMVIETKKDNSAPCRFTITNLAEGWTYEEGSRRESGTKITLFLNDQGKGIDVAKSLGHYAKTITIPLFLKNSETGKRRKFVQTWDYSIPEVLEECSKDKRKRFSLSKPSMTLHAVTPDLDVCYHVFDERNFSSNKNCYLSKHGIYINNFDFFPSINTKWIALVDCKSDLLDLTVSREDLVRNEKFEGFLNSLYDTLFDAVTSKIGRDDESLEGITKFSTYMQQFFLHSFGVERESKKSLWYLKFFKRRTFPVLQKTGLTFLRGDQIVSRRFSKVVHYAVPLDFCKEHITIIAQMSLPKMEEDKVIVFDPGPSFFLIQTIPRKFLCSFCEFLKSKETKAVSCYDLVEFMTTFKFSKEITPLDALLPHASFFTHMPADFRGLTAQQRPFQFKPSLNVLLPSRPLRTRLYADLVGKELFCDEPEVEKFYNDRLSGERKLYKLLSPGCFVYDIDDVFLIFLISKAEHILSNESVKKLVKRYLNMLALSSLTRRYRVDIVGGESCSAVLLEKTIADMLDYPKKYEPLADRMSKLARIYNLERF